MLCESEYHRTSGLLETFQHKGLLGSQQTSEIGSKQGSEGSDCNWIRLYAICIKVLSKTVQQ